MKRLLSLAAVILLCAAAWAAERAFNVNSAVHELHVTAGADVDYVPSAGKVRVIVSGPDENVDNVLVTCDKGVLKISSKQGSSGGFSLFNFKRYIALKDVKITLYAPPIATIHVSAGAELKAKSMISLSDKAASVKASSGADVELKYIECKSLECVSSSGADVEIEGLKAVEASFKSSSGSDIEAKGLDVGQVKASASSGSDISLKGRASKADLKASSGASVKSGKLMSADKRRKSSSGGSVK